MNKYIVIILLLMPCALYAQSERRDVRHGNKLFSQGKYADSEKSYQSALGKNSASKEAAFNLGAALYKQGRWADAQQTYTTLAQEGGAGTAFNLGNACFQQRNEQGKLDEAIEGYKTSLRINPSDMEAKFNLAYAQKLKKEQDNKDNNDKDKDKNQDQNKDQKDQNKDQDKDQNKDEQPKDQDKQDQKDKDQKPEPQSQSKQDAERMLKAIQAAENKTQEKVDAQKAKAVGASRSSKDW